MFRNPFPFCFKRLKSLDPLNIHYVYMVYHSEESRGTYSISVTLKAIQILWQDLIVLSEGQRNSGYLIIHKRNILCSYKLGAIIFKPRVWQMTFKKQIMIHVSLFFTNLLLTYTPLRLNILSIFLFNHKSGHFSTTAWPMAFFPTHVLCATDNQELNNFVVLSTEVSIACSDCHRRGSLLMA